MTNINDDDDKDLLTNKNNDPSDSLPSLPSFSSASSSLAEEKAKQGNSSTDGYDSSSSFMQSNVLSNEKPSSSTSHVTPLYLKNLHRQISKWDDKQIVSPRKEFNNEIIDAYKSMLDVLNKLR
ncbi:12475_t:CDS:2 [Ambispora gerdemannii]|uniref:12475_t:CDS:1 n=1 Tax=Ambispora gerdemannii TaxID=144530 RepID=A0A9N9FPG7_9GLOM|nr:12475_t:CDS:2 [Ambispora gerdemannii]